MTGSASALRAYLEVQADLGTDDVILPYPLERRQSPSAATHPSSHRSAPIPPRTENQAESFAEYPAGSRSAAAASPTALDSGLTGSPATDSLFATLSQAMSASAGQASAPHEAITRSRPASVSLPVFADLGAYWDHLAAQPGLAAGDPDAGAIRLVRGQGQAGAPLAIVGLEPGEADAAAGLAFQGEPGILLAKMLKAIRLDAEACYRTNLVKASRATRATRRDIGRLLPWLHSDLALVKAPIALLLGEACAQAVLKTGKPIEELRQEPFRIEGREFIVTYHPAELLAREELKKKAWEDLQWLQKRMAEGA